MTAVLDRPVASAPPRFLSVPLHASSEGQDCIDFAAGAGLVLDDWQCDIIRAALGTDPSGQWAAMEVGLIVPRQNGKGGLLEALELFHLFMVPSTTLITHTAHRFDTCLDHFRRIRKLIEDTDQLRELVKDNGRGIGDTPSGIKDSNGKESIELADGSKLNFKAREKGSGRGFSGDLVVLDEAFWLKDLSGLIPTMAARDNPQAWYTSSAPLPRIESDQLRKLMRDGRKLAEDPEFIRPDPDDPTMAYFEWSDDATADEIRTIDLEDEGRIRRANPAFGIRLNRRFCKMERKRMGDDAYARERLGIVEIPDEDDGPRWEFVTEAQWNAAADPASDDSPDAGWFTSPVALALEVPPDRSLVSIAAAGACRAGGVGIDLVAQVPVDQLVALMLRLTTDEGHPVTGTVIDPNSPAGALIPDLTAAGVTVSEVTFADLKRATGDTYDGLTADEPEIHHRARTTLTRSAAVSTRRKSGDAWLIDRWADPESAPMSAAVLARHGHLHPPEQPKKFRAGGFR